MSATREVSLDTIDRLNEIRADLHTVHVALTGNPENEEVVYIGTAVYHVIMRFEAALRACGEAKGGKP